MIVTVREDEPFWHFGQFRISAGDRKHRQLWFVNNYRVNEHIASSTVCCMSSFLSASTSRKDYEGDSQCGAYARMSLADGPVHSATVSKLCKGAGISNSGVIHCAKSPRLTSHVQRPMTPTHSHNIRRRDHQIQHQTLGSLPSVELRSRSINRKTTEVRQNNQAVETERYEPDN
ncbi:hypothetical protein M405DRAFT_593722 [Rhizopogon salebrosus TDB-379]|nr:hypothetical protein M405DRAFT_593722 [Rhizopogon salebrosus TDB-379]